MSRSYVSGVVVALAVLALQASVLFFAVAQPIGEALQAEASAPKGAVRPAFVEVIQVQAKRAPARHG